MKAARIVAASLALAFAVLPAQAQTETAGKSEAGTAFMQRCLEDVTAHRIATLKRQVPDYAAGLSDEELTAGGMSKARRACPCFLQIIAVDPDEDGSPEAKVARIVAYLETPDPAAVPLVVTRLTRMCGERSSVLPPSWIGR